MFSVQHDVLDNFLTLVNISSESGEEAEIVEYLIKRLKLYTKNIYLDKGNNSFPKGVGNIIAKIKGNPRLPSILFCAHMDTVKPGKNINPQILNNIIKTDGKTILAADDKAGIAAILTLLKVIHKDKFDSCPIEIVFTVGEESWLMGSKKLSFDKITSKYGFILDSDGDIGGAVIKAPSYMYMNISVLGKAAHAGMDAKAGINAIKIAAEAVSKIPTGYVDSETTINVGKINGGMAINIVPELCNVEYEIRSYQDKNIKKYQAFIESAFKSAAKKYKGNVNIESDFQFKKFEIEHSAKTVALFKNACKRLNLDVKMEKSFGGSDANIFNEKGIETLNLSVGYSKPHTSEETIKLSSLKEIVDVIYTIVQLSSENNF
ncbi:M20/M25/M40 family metallo-hydrolase [Candidatus Dependentiae bacterium]|nr:M20/M25/M40 family metallo-hydrolase [Candidatus Dependentiae bacterium]